MYTTPYRNGYRPSNGPNGVTGDRPRVVIANDRPAVIDEGVETLDITFVVPFNGSKLAEAA